MFMFADHFLLLQTLSCCCSTNILFAGIFLLLQDYYVLFACGRFGPPYKLNELIQFHAASSGQLQDGHDHLYSQPQSKRRKVASATRRRMPSVVQVSQQMLGPVEVHGNMASDSPLYANYVRKLITEGTLKWRLHKDGRDIIVMNDIDAASGSLRPSCLVHVTRLQSGDIMYHCSCQVYNLIKCSVMAEAPEQEFVISGLTCMHCRFLKEEVEKHIPVCLMAPLQPPQTSMKYSTQQ